MLLTPAQIKPKLFESRRNSLFLTRGGYVSCLRAHLGTRLLPVLLVLKPFRGHWPREDKECPFSGVTKSSRVWRKVPESDAWSVCVCVCVSVYVCMCVVLLFGALKKRLWGFELWGFTSDVPMVEFMYLVFTCMPSESYHRWFRYLLLCLCDIFPSFHI